MREPSSASNGNMSALPQFPLDQEDDVLDSSVLEDDDDRPTPRDRQQRPPFESGVSLGAGLDERSFAQRAELEWHLHHRGRFALEHHKIAIATLERLDAMFDRLPNARSLEEAIRCVHDSFVHDDERRAGLVPLLGVLYPLAFFDGTMPTEDIAHHERRKPAKPILSDRK